MKHILQAIILMAMVIAGNCLVYPQNMKKDQQAYPRSGFKAEYMRQFDDVESKMLALAELFSQKKYSWRPMKGVRSVSEVFVHVAVSNYLFPQFAGFKPSAILDRDPEKSVTKKPEVVAMLKDSFLFMRQCLLDMPDADLDKKTKMFGEETTMRGVFFNAAIHMHEHLGQMIAYARTNRLVPPWTVAEKAGR